MMGLWQWLYDLSLSTTLRNSIWAFPVIECIHIYSMISLIGLFVAFDMRLMGFAMGGKQRRRPISELAKVVLRWIWIPVVVNAVTGTLMFAPNALTYSSNWAFRSKMLLVLLGLIYHVPLLFKAVRWNESSEIPIGMKLISIFSILVWAGVIVASRWIAYV
jgi:uncharacterized protein DUF6644